MSQVRTDRLDDSWAESLDRIRAFVAARVDDPELAADITHDVVVRSIASGALDRVDNPAAWLYRSARNAVIDHYRTRHPHQPLDGVDSWPDPGPTDNQPNDATRELAQCLQPMLHQLPPTARDALTRIYVNGQTHQQAADQLGISVSGMKSRVQRARRQLKDQLDDAALSTSTERVPSPPTAPRRRRVGAGQQHPARRRPEPCTALVVGE